MKSYRRTALTSVFLSWLVSSLVYNLLALLIIGPLDFKVWVIFFGPCSLLFSILANLIFVQTIEKRVASIFFTTTRMEFATFSLVYGTIIFALTIGLVLNSYVYGEHRILFFIQAVVNSFSYGIIFHSIWKSDNQLRK